MVPLSLLPLKDIAATDPELWGREPDNAISEKSNCSSMKDSISLGGMVPEINVDPNWSERLAVALPVGPFRPQHSESSETSSELPVTFSRYVNNAPKKLQESLLAGPSSFGSVPLILFSNSQKAASRPTSGCIPIVPLM